MFEYIHHSKVLIMGYPRCGSHITAVIVAYDTGLCYAHEDRWGKRDPDGLWNYLETHDGFVTPAPGVFDFARFGVRDDTFIVLVRRPARDIRASSLRVHDGHAGRYSDGEALWLTERRYDYWDYCKFSIKHYAEIDYASLAEHPLWLPSEVRKDFSQVQIHPSLDYKDLVNVC
jgi:hypothetical protein